MKADHQEAEEGQETMEGDSIKTEDIKGLFDHATGLLELSQVKDIDSNITSLMEIKQDNEITRISKSFRSSCLVEESL